MRGSARTLGPHARSVGGSPGSTQRCVNVRVWPTGVARCRPRPSSRTRLRDHPSHPRSHDLGRHLAAQQPPHPLTQFTGALLRQRGRRYARAGCRAVQVGHHALSATAARIDRLKIPGLMECTTRPRPHEQVRPPPHGNDHGNTESDTANRLQTVLGRPKPVRRCGAFEISRKAQRCHHRRLRP